MNAEDSRNGLQIRQIGTAVFHNLSGCISWFESLSPDQGDSANQTVMDAYPMPSHGGILVNSAENLYRNRSNEIFRLSYWSSYPIENSREYKWPRHREKIVSEIQEMAQMSEQYAMPIRVSVWTETLAYIYLGNPRKGFWVLDPEQYLIFTPNQDYSSLTTSQVRMALNVPQNSEAQAIIPADMENDITVSDIRIQTTMQEQAIDEVKKQIEATNKYETAELAALYAEIERKKQEMYAKQHELMVQLEEKLEELEQTKFTLENQIFLLESQIYAIRCFAGEVVKFAQIRSGKAAPDTEPIVVHQKLRFLDEDLGRLASIYTIHWEDTHLFEDFLRYSPLALDTFAPNERCITLVRLSKDGKQIAEDHEIPYRNILEKYNYYHGRTVGILIRNGENLYLGWTDEEWIDIEDDLIISQVIKESQPAPAQEFHFKSERERYMKKRRQEYRTLMEGMASRSFVYNIVQGVVEHTSILPLPKGVTLSKQSEYVRYAIADTWITDNKYGSFNEIVDRCNSKVTKGDTILTVQHLTPEWEKCFPQVNENSRGRGYANRTRDVEADNCTLYPVNLVELDEPISWTTYSLAKDPKGKFEYRIRTKDLDRLDPECTIGETYSTQDRHVFISLKKAYSECGSTSNFEVYPSEFVNLTYMNSGWLEWAITTKTLGGWCVGGKAVNYAWAIKYMKVALDFVREREAREKELLDAIDPVICQDPEWPVKLSEWKLEKNVREITAYQAKRFAKHFCA